MRLAGFHLLPLETLAQNVSQGGFDGLAYWGDHFEVRHQGIVPAHVGTTAMPGGGALARRPQACQTLALIAS